MERRPEILNGRKCEGTVDRGSGRTDLAQARFVNECGGRGLGIWRALGRRCAMLIFGAAVALGGGGEARAQVGDGTIAAPDAADLFDTAWELAQRAEALVRFSIEARGRIVVGWSETAEVSLLADALYDLATVQAEHAHAALTVLFEQGDLTLAIDELSMANYFSQQAEAAVAAVSVAAGLPPAVPGGAEVNTTLPIPDGKYEGWIIPEEALANAVVVRIDPSSAAGDALEAWRNAIDTDAKWLGERAFVDDLWVKDPIVVSELFAVGPRWLGEGGDIYKGQTLHLQNVWVLKTKDVYEAVKQPELMTALSVGGWDAGATAWECPGGEIFVPALYEGKKVVCRTERVTLPDGLFAPDGNPWVDIATDCSLVPEKMGECKAVGGGLDGEVAVTGSLRVGWLDRGRLPAGIEAADLIVTRIALIGTDGSETLAWRGTTNVDVGNQLAEPLLIAEVAAPEGDYAGIEITVEAGEYTSAAGSRTLPCAQCAGPFEVREPIKIVDGTTTRAVVVFDTSASLSKADAPDTNVELQPLWTSLRDQVSSRTESMWDNRVATDGLRAGEESVVWGLAHNGAHAFRVRFGLASTLGCNASVTFKLPDGITSTPIDLVELVQGPSAGWSDWIAGSSALVTLTTGSGCTASSGCDTDAPSPCGEVELRGGEAKTIRFAPDYAFYSEDDTTIRSGSPAGFLFDGDPRLFNRDGKATGSTVSGAYTSARLSTLSSSADRPFPGTVYRGELTENAGDPCTDPLGILARYERIVCRPGHVVLSSTRQSGDCVFENRGFDMATGQEIIVPNCDGFAFNAGVSTELLVPNMNLPEHEARIGPGTHAREPVCRYGSDTVYVRDGCQWSDDDVVDPDGNPIDTDCDGLGDWVEACIEQTCTGLEACTYPHNHGADDTDGDGWWDGLEVCGGRFPNTDIYDVNPAWFTSPRVRDTVADVVVDMQNVAWRNGTPILSSPLQPVNVTDVQAIVNEANRRAQVRPSADDTLWEPVGFSTASIVAAPVDDTTGRPDEAAALTLATLARDTNNLIFPVIVSDNGATSSANSERVFIGYGHAMDSRPWVAPTTWMHEFGHRNGLAHGGSRPTGPGGELQPYRRQDEPRYLSVMSYVYMWQMEAYQGLRYSSGALPRMTEYQTSEYSYSPSSAPASLKWQDSFYVDDPVGSATAYLIRSAGRRVPGIGIIQLIPVDNSDCRTAGMVCPDGYACVQQGPRDGIRGPLTTQTWDPDETDRSIAPEPVGGNCMRVTEGRDWDDDGERTPNLSFENYLTGAITRGWETDTDCEFQYSAPLEGTPSTVIHENTGYWRLRPNVYAGSCDLNTVTRLPNARQPVQQPPNTRDDPQLPGTSLEDQTAVPFEICVNDGSRRRHLWTDATGNVLAQTVILDTSALASIPAGPARNAAQAAIDGFAQFQWQNPNTGSMSCVWVSRAERHDFQYDEPHVDSADYDDLVYPQFSVSACSVPPTQKSASGVSSGPPMAIIEAPVAAICKGFAP